MENTKSHYIRAFVFALIASLVLTMLALPALAADNDTETGVDSSETGDTGNDANDANDADNEENADNAENEEDKLGAVITELDGKYEKDPDGNYVMPETSSGFHIFDVLLIPMGFIIRVCYSVTQNYALALLLFAIVMQLILFPLGIKQQKNMNKQAALRPKENAIRKKYAGRSDAVTQRKMNDEIMALYQQENFNPASGCLPLLIQLPIIFALFAVVRQPLTYITRLSSDAITVLQSQANALGATMAPGYEEIGVISYLKDSGTEALRGIGNIVNADMIDKMPNFRMFGGAFDLSIRPGDQLWSLYLLVPILTFVFMYGSMKLTRKFSYQPQPATGDAQSNASMKIMELLSPVMCTYFAFIVPSAIGIYWMYRNVLAFVQQFVLSKIYPIPKFTEEQLKEAEREYLGKTKKTKAERDPNKPKPRSLHRIDFDDDDDDEETPALPEKTKPKKDSPIESAPLKSDEKDK